MGFRASAMTVLAFGKMNNDDEATYVALLVQGAADKLKADGQPAQSDKVIAMFHDPSKEGGVAQFAANLKTINATNKRNAINPNNRAKELQVEDAMSLTLKDAGIDVPAKYLMSLTANFMPQGPPRAFTPGQH